MIATSPTPSASSPEQTDSPSHVDAVHIRWPADRFYWSVVDAPGMRVGFHGEVPDGVLLTLAEDLPVPLEDVRAVCTAIASSKLLVAAVRRDGLLDLAPEVLSLTPESVPEFAAGMLQRESDGNFDELPSKLNLLVGDCEPLPIVRARQRTRRTTMAAVVVVSVLVTAGLSRRAEIWQAQADQARHASRDTIRAALAGTATDASKLPTPPTYDVFTLQHAVNARHEARTAQASFAAPKDVTPSLASVLAGWPGQVPSETQSIAINPSGASIAVAVEGDPSAFLTMLTPPLGWTLDEPRLNKAGPVTRLSLRVRPSETVEGVKKP